MTLEAIIKLALAIFGSLGFWEFLKFLIQSKRKKKSAEQEALLALLQAHLYPMLEKIYFRGVIGYDEATNIDQLYSPYRRLGGNSVVKSRYELVAKLERVKDEELKIYDTGVKNVREKGER